MSKSRFLPALSLLSMVVLSSWAACQNAKVSGNGDPVTPGRPGQGGANGSGGGGVILPPAGGVSLPDASAGGRDAGADTPANTGPCKPATCTPAGGQYCGTVG